MDLQTILRPIWSSLLEPNKASLFGVPPYDFKVMDASPSRLTGLITFDPLPLNSYHHYQLFYMSAFSWLNTSYTSLNV